MQHYIKELSAQESVTILRALGSSVRARIVAKLAEREMNIGELSSSLGMPQPSVSKHIQVLEEAGVVVSEYSPAPQGMQKKCHLVFERLIVDVAPKVSDHDNISETELPIGMFSSVEVRPTCGLATKEKFIGLVDAPVSFHQPERAQAEILWSGGGWVEYDFPNTLPVYTEVKAIELVMEVCSEAPGYDNNYPSDITLWVNGQELGTWTSPGDFGGTRGQLNPSWYPDNMNQWGVLKTWLVDDKGVFVDGVKLSDTTLPNLNIHPWMATKVRIGVKDDARNQGGFTLFGKGFGNYQLGLVLRFRHELHPGEPAAPLR